MDINANISQQAVATHTSLKPVSGKVSVDSSALSEAGAAGKAEIRVASVRIADGDKVKGNNDKDADDLKQAVGQLNDYVQNVQRNLQFSIDKESGAMVVKVIDSKTEKIIRQMPTEETLRLARHLAEDKQDATFNIFSSRA